MECAICYEHFFTPKNQEEFEKIYNENVKIYNENVKNDYAEIMKFENLLITHKHNNTHYCSTSNCECLICGDCWIKITHNGKGIDEMNEDDMPSIYDYFECPYCRQVDWKYYMKNVFNELQKQVLGEKEFIKIFCEKISSRLL
jgi:hypothetical protein